MVGTIILLTLVVFVVAMLGMAAGLILSNRRLRGSCGGMAGIRDRDGNTLCDLCSDPSPECRGEPRDTNETSAHA
jgi:hypothetical protein